MIVLDTDAVSELMRPRPAQHLISRLADVPVREQATTAITIGELRYGAELAGRPELYLRAMELLVAVSVLDFDRRAAEVYGEVRALLEGAGRALSDPDLRIAATVLAHEATLVSGNLRHFQQVPGLRVENWIRSSSRS